MLENSNRMLSLESYAILFEKKKKRLSSAVEHIIHDFFTLHGYDLAKPDKIILKMKKP